MSPTSYQISVIGAGSWGTAVANFLAQNGHKVTIWARRASVSQEISTQHTNAHYLPDVRLDDRLHSTSGLQSAVTNTDALIFATPSAVLLETAQQAAEYITAAVPVLLLTKGICAGENVDRVNTGSVNTNKGANYLFSEQISQILPNSSVSVLSGPTHAEEVVRQKLSAAVIASDKLSVAEFWQAIVNSEHFRVYTSTDLTGVQLLGAGKNVIALACGIAAGLDMGDNAQALIMTRGLAELTRLVVAAVAAAGGNANTSAHTSQGLAGMGDLIVTCTSAHSRNRSFGEALVAGELLTDYEARTGMVVEGAAAVTPLCKLAEALKVDLPICTAVAKSISNPHNITEIIAGLVGRAVKPEVYK